jgi:hypothetical protein
MAKPKAVGVILQKGGVGKSTLQIIRLPMFVQKGCRA